MYRVFSLNGMVGAGFGNAAAFENALHNFTFDLVANDAGSMDMGPAYLGSGTQFFDDADVLVDLRYLLPPEKVAVDLPSDLRRWSARLPRTGPD
jgi:hypothetical protein